MASVFIDGEAGTTGLGIRERLAALPVTLLQHRARAAQGRRCRRAMMAQVDVVVLCLPDDAAREAVALAAPGATRPVCSTPAPPTARRPAGPMAFPNWRPARRRDRRRAAGQQPGLLCHRRDRPAAPADRCRADPADHPLSINAVSGYSGGGRSMIEAHEAAGGPAFELYGLALDHKHVPEIAHIRGWRAGRSSCPRSGISARACWSASRSISTRCRAARPADLRDALACALRGQPLVQVSARGELGCGPDALADTDRLELHVFADEAHGHAVLVARLDNLGKGAVRRGGAEHPADARPGRRQRARPPRIRPMHCGGPLWSLDGVRHGSPDAWIAPTATVIGDVEVGPGASVWFGCVLRGDTNLITHRRAHQHPGRLHPAREPRRRHGLPDRRRRDGRPHGHRPCRPLEDGAFVGMAAVVLDGAVIERRRRAGRGCGPHPRQAHRRERDVGRDAGAAGAGVGRSRARAVCPDGARLCAECPAFQAGSATGVAGCIVAELHRISISSLANTIQARNSWRSCTQ